MFSVSPACQFKAVLQGLETLLSVQFVLGISRVLAHESRLVNSVTALLLALFQQRSRQSSSKLQYAEYP